jgi:transcription elongation factor GreA
MGTAQVGAQVTICEDVEGAEEEVYTIVGAAEANPREGRISNESPLGKALMSKKAGERAVVEAPQGSYAVRLLKVD